MSASENPSMTRATRPPCPSTNAFVASVVDMDTSLTAAGSTAARLSTASTAPEMPTARSCRVVSALALATTPAVSDHSTASV